MEVLRRDQRVGRSGQETQPTALRALITKLGTTAVARTPDLSCLIRVLLIRVKIESLGHLFCVLLNSTRIRSAEKRSDPMS